MHRLITPRCCRLALGSAAALALIITPYQIALHGPALGVYASSAQAAEGGGKGGGDNGGGKGNSGDSGGGGKSGTDGGDGGNSGSSQGKNDNSDDSHVNVTTGDRVDVEGNKITVQHPDGMMEKIENGRFRMEDALGRTIVDRRATPADVSRLKAL